MRAPSGRRTHRRSLAPLPLPLPPQTKPGAPVPVETNLCELGSVCEEGRLVGFHAQGWYMTCPFPGDLFAGFPRLRGLWANWNYFSGDINEVGVACLIERGVAAGMAADGTAEGGRGDALPGVDASTAHCL